jgi:hypothetical protein
VRVELATMGEAIDAYGHKAKFTGQDKDREMHKYAKTHAVDGGDANALARAIEKSDALIDAAVIEDPRLARRVQWVRSEDGIFADAGLVSMGDDSPCYQMAKNALKDIPASGEPINICICTDSNEPTSLAAFIAVVRIVQQFRPVNVWWQGSWLADDGRDVGYVFHTPLITNDMDFSRCQYVIADSTRDNLSFGLLHQYAQCRDRVYIRGMGRHADRAYMPGAKFVNKEGITADAYTVARTACQWLDWESTYWIGREADEAQKAALQSIPGVDTGYTSEDKRTPAQRERDANKARREGNAWTKRHLRRQEQEAKARMGTV